MRRSGEIQRLEDDMGGAMPTTLATLAGQAFAVRCLELVANVAIGREPQALFRHRRAAADAIVLKRLSTLHPCRAM